MKKKLLVFNLVLVVLVVVSSFTTFCAIENGEDDGNGQHLSNTYSGPGALENPFANGNNVYAVGETQANASKGEVASNDAGIIDTNQILKYTFASGVYFECPRNLMTYDGLVTTENYEIRDKASEKWSYDGVIFDYTGLRDKQTEFYILAYDANGLVIDTQTVRCYYESDYNAKKEKYVYKKLTETCYYTIPDGVSKVIVTGKLENAVDETINQ